MASDTNFSDFFESVSTVLKAADESLKVLQTKIPTDFFEEEPPLIGPSYIEYITDQQDFTATTVLERFEQGYYSSVYPLYHDIRLSAFIVIHQLEIGSDRYVDIDRFYKFSTELLLRESFRLNIDKSSLNFPERSSEPTDFDLLLSQDFIKISTTYTLGNSEAYYLSTQNNIPLFSSSNQRSSLDEREVILPPPFSKTEILPHAYVPTFNTFANISPIRQQQQQSTSQSEILSRFLHPNWYSLPTSKWLEGSDLQSFAPLVDEQYTVVTSADKARLWFEHIGIKKLIKDEGALSGSQDIDIDATQDANEPPSVISSQADFVRADSPEEIGSISLENLYEWEPFNEIGDDEIEAFETGKELELVTSLLSQLQKKQSERSGLLIDENKPTIEERQLYFKVKRVLREIAIKAESLPDIKLSSALPILQTDYTGTLPVPTQNVTKKKNKPRR